MTSTIVFSILLVIALVFAVLLSNSLSDFLYQDEDQRKTFSDKDIERLTFKEGDGERRLDEVVLTGDIHLE
jgi:hypothetical protein